MKGRFYFKYFIGARFPAHPEPGSGFKEKFFSGVPIKVCELRQEGYDTRGNASFGPGRYLGIANANFTVLDDGDEVHVVVE